MLFRMAQHNNTLIGLTTNGFSILNDFYTKNEVQKIGKVLQDHFDQSAEPTFACIFKVAKSQTKKGHSP
jgi:hypothetical protein